MKVKLDRIEQLPNGDARIVINNAVITNFSNKRLLSFTIPEGLAGRACRFIIDTAFNPNNESGFELNILNNSKEKLIEIISHSLGNHKDVYYISQYTLD